MSYDEALDLLEVKKNTTSDDELIEEVDYNNLDKLKVILKKAEAKYYAFLNKEFNSLNKKLINCNIYCYDNPNVSKY